MKKIELSISTAMSLDAMSSAGSEEIEEDEIIDEGPDDAALAMSDEDFEKMSEEEFAEAGDSDDDKDDDDEDEDPDHDIDNDNDEDNSNLGDDDNNDESNDDADEDETPNPADDGGSEQATEDEKSEEAQPNDTEQLNENGMTEKQQEAFNLLYGDPIKASGREVQIRNPEHARNFIEMGIDYNKKMHAMKPHQKVLKTLEREGLLESGQEEKLNLLLEVQKGNKDALKRLIAESDIDPLELADEEIIQEGKGYKPDNHIVSQQEVEIEEAFNAIEGSPSKDRTIQVMTKQFDAKSREVISNNPRYIVALNKDIEDGVFDKVMENVQYQRDMRMVPNDVSDMELYIQIVQNAGGQQQAAPAPVAIPQNQTPTETKNSKPASSKRRKVGMSNNRSSSKKSKREYDPLEVMNMSDDDFEKQFGSELI